MLRSCAWSIACARSFTSAAASVGGADDADGDHAEVHAGPESGGSGDSGSGGGQADVGPEAAHATAGDS